MDHTVALSDAQALITTGRTEAAEDLLEANRDDEGCLVRLRELFLGEGRNEEAAELIQTLALGSGPESLVSRAILAFQKGNLQTANRECQNALAMNPDLATAHNHAGRILHNMGKTDGALGSFRRAIELDANYSEAWHNLGHALRARGDMAAASNAYQSALKLAPAYHSAANNLGITLFHMDKVNEAMNVFDGMLERNADDVDALVGGGLTQQLLGQFDSARHHFEHAIELDPGNAMAHLYLGILLNELAETQAAITSLQTALRLDPGDVEAWIELAGVYEQINQVDDANRALQKGLAVAPGHPGLHIEAAKLERRRGEVGNAVRRLRGIDPRQLPKRVAQQYFFELGHALDRNKDADAAVQAFTSANQLAGNSVGSQRIDRDAFARRCDDLEGWLKKDAPGASVNATDPKTDEGEDLCFLVGFNRSGTTLIDTMLATNPNVASVEESATLEFVIAELTKLPDGYPWALESIGPDTLDKLRHCYRSAMAGYLGDARPELTVDKLPLRLMHAGLISRLFPRSRMLFVLRHPCDVVLSNFMQNYAVNESTIHFDTLEHCVHMYDRVMRLWHESESRLELRLEYVRYEALIEDVDVALDRVCDFLGLNREETQTHEQSRLQSRERVRTASYQQIAEPIYQRAAGRWTRYRQHLEPYIPLLMPYIKRYGYAVDE